MIKKKKKKGILHSEPYLLTDNSYFTAADYIVLQAVNILFFFFTVHEGSINSTCRSSTLIKTKNDSSYFSVLPLHPLVSKFQGTLRKVISFVMCDSLFASVHTGNFLMGPPVILLPLIFKKTPWNSLGDTCHRL